MCHAENAENRKALDPIKDQGLFYYKGFSIINEKSSDPNTSGGFESEPLGEPYEESHPATKSLGSHLPLGDRQACLPGEERANIRPSEIPVFDIAIIWLTNKKETGIPKWAPVSFCLCFAQNRTHLRYVCTCKFAENIRRARGSHTSPRSAQGIAVARRCVNIAKSGIITVYLTRAPHSRTCLPLGILFVLITLVVLLSCTISSPGNIPHSRNAPNKVT